MLIPTFGMRRCVSSYLRSLVRRALGRVRIVMISSNSASGANGVTRGCTTLSGHFRIIRRSRRNITATEGIYLSLTGKGCVKFMSDSSCVSRGNVRRLFLYTRARLTSVILNDVLRYFRSKAYRQVNSGSFGRQLCSRPVSKGRLFGILVRMKRCAPVIYNGLCGLTFVQRSRLYFRTVFRRSRFFAPCMLCFTGEIVYTGRSFCCCQRQTGSVVGVNAGLERHSNSLCFVDTGLARFTGDGVTDRRVGRTFLLRTDSLYDHTRRLCRGRLCHSSGEYLFVVARRDVTGRCNVNACVQRLARYFGLIR